MYLIGEGSFNINDPPQPCGVGFLPSPQDQPAEAVCMSQRGTRNRQQHINNHNISPPKTIFIAPFPFPPRLTPVYFQAQVLAHLLKSSSISSLLFLSLSSSQSPRSQSALHFIQFDSAPSTWRPVTQNPNQQIPVASPFAGQPLPPRPWASR